MTALQDHAAALAHRLVWGVADRIREPNGADLARLVDEMATELRKEEPSLHMSVEVHKALGIVLAEFGFCDLPETLKYLRHLDAPVDVDTEEEVEEANQQADELEAAFGLVEQWYETNRA
jgi:hypothetical protein